MASSIISKTLPRHRGALAPLLLYTLGAITSSQSKETTHNDSRLDHHNKNKTITPPNRNGIQHHHHLANSPSRKVYDYIIIGYGTAGKSAHATLKKLDPASSIALIDPFVPPSSSSSSSSSSDRFNQMATHINHQQKNLTLSPSPSSPTTTLSFRKSILIATGSRGAPIPTSLVDESARPRLLEWKTTQAPSFSSASFPSLPPTAISMIAHQAISQGATIAIMGNGIEALSLASSLSQHAPRQQRRSSSSSKPPIILLSGHSHPLSSILPSYLTPLLSSRLEQQQQHVTVANRALVRYISAASKNGVEIHTLRRGDDLDTQRYHADLVIVIPSTNDERGTGYLPSSGAWSHAGSLLTCTAIDGRLVTNRELYAGGGVYAAGSVVRYPCSRDGMARTTDDSRRMGMMAARNMVMGGGWAFDNDNDDDNRIVPVFRWEWGDEWGVRVVGVGDCQSRYATHGFWWTNVAASRRRRLTRRRGGTTKVGVGFKPVYGVGMIYYFNEGGRLCGIMSWGLQHQPRQGNDDGGGEEEDPVIQRMKQLIQTNAAVAIPSPDDKNTTNMTIMATTNRDDDDLNINHLMEETKSLVKLSITTNHVGNHNDNIIIIPDVAFDDDSNNNNNMARPLYRYTAAKPTSQSQLGYIKTNNNSQDCLFLPTTTTPQNNTRHPSLVKVYPMDTGRTTPSTANNDVVDPSSTRRPAKEELLWYRQFEISYNVKEEREREFLDNMKKGRFADGSYVLGGRRVDNVVSEEDVEEEEMGDDE